MQYTCTLTSDYFDDNKSRFRLGVRDDDGVRAAFYTDDDRRLYLAAPDMLAALEAMIEYYDYDLSESNIPATPCKRAREVLGKAKGE